MEYLFAAFFIVWLFLFVYLFGIDRKQKRLFEEIEKLKSGLGAQ